MSDCNPTTDLVDESSSKAPSQDARHAPVGAEGGVHAACYAHYPPRHYAPHPPPRDDVDPLDCASIELSRERLARERADGVLEEEHGELVVETPPARSGALRQRAHERKAAGLKAVVSSFHYAVSEAGVIRGTLPLLRLNQKTGFDCMSCAWPDPYGK